MLLGMYFFLFMACSFNELCSKIECPKGKNTKQYQSKHGPQDCFRGIHNYWIHSKVTDEKYRLKHHLKSTRSFRMLLHLLLSLKKPQH